MAQMDHIKLIAKKQNNYQSAQIILLQHQERDKALKRAELFQNAMVKVHQRLIAGQQQKEVLFK